MSNLTTDEFILLLFKGLDLEPDADGYNWYREEIYNYEPEPEELSDPQWLDGCSAFWTVVEDAFYKEGVVDGYVIRKVDSYGGEGQGDDYYIVFEVERLGNKQYFRRDGFYSSYEGVDWTYRTLREVTPKTVEVVVYE